MTGYTIDSFANEKFSTANIIIDKMNEAYGKQPYVKLSGECGVPGDYIHLSYEYLRDLNPSSLYGDVGKIVL